MPKIECALLSVFDKTNLEKSARRLVERGIEIWASGGTAKYLNSNGIVAKSVEESTGFSELLAGRVKTLHPAVFSAILARPNGVDIQQVKKLGFPIFDLVFVDLYPFMQNLGSKNHDELVELIDIGGVALLRAAAKNYERVVPIFSLEQLENAIDTMDRDNNFPIEISKILAGETFYFTSAYDSTIANWLAKTTDDLANYPEHFSIGGKKLQNLRYGENPHQSASVYGTFPSEGIPSAEILWGKQLSYNNYLDLDAALYGAIEFDEPSCTIVKHLSPCGIAIGDNPNEAYKKALVSDSLSSFGGIVAFNRPVDSELAEFLHEHFFECILAPDYDDSALKILEKKKNVRILKLPEILPKSKISVRGIFGGLLVQDINPPKTMAEKWDVVTERKPTDDEEMQMCFAMRAAKIIKSNTVVIVKNNATVGIGGGLPSRVDAAILAVCKAGDKAKNAVAASDAFLPFPDTLYVLAQAGITALVQPGGSRNDHLSIEAANKLGIAMVFTGMRHFKH
ncbi:bifunctional phosphoribosylaminoimidazolecarboxamide formyltransferase/IMP cyclohydrolase [bacterium]|nr:bifunctional phosphoribosylaminoimidazolecarboxamide formyltransferase/IMP cyclohydrolase [bacterium]